jgi:hypothetical protein
MMTDNSLLQSTSSMNDSPDRKRNRETKMKSPPPQQYVYQCPKCENKQQSLPILKVRVGESPGIEEHALLHPVTVRNMLEDESRLNVDVNYRTVN